MTCQICESEYREEIDGVAKKGIRVTDIAKVYFDLYGISEEAMYKSLKRHLRGKHPPSIYSLDITPIRLAKAKNKYTEGPMNIDTYAQVLLEEGFKPEQIRKLSPGHILTAQRILIEKQKAKAEEDAIRIGMAKLMSGLATTSDLIEGEVVNGVAELTEKN